MPITIPKNFFFFSLNFNFRKLLLQIFIFYITILSFSWMLLNYGGDGENPYTGSGVRWLILTIPLLFFVFANITVFLFKPVIKSDLISLSLLSYVYLGFFISIIYQDLGRFFDLARFAIPVFFIYHFRLYVTLKFINTIFFLALFVVVLTYDSSSLYGYLPGQTTINLHNGLWWRISIWKYITPPYSAAFCLIVLVVNLLISKSWIRFVIIPICLYFIVLSASRTSYIIFIAIIFIIFLTRRYDFRSSILYYVIPFLLAFLLFAFQFLSDAITLLNFQNQFFQSAILRSTEYTDGTQTLSSRLLIIAEHIRIMSEAPAFGFFGVGSSIFESTAWTVNGGFLGGSSDSYITHLAARDGILVVFLVIAFIQFIRLSCRERNLLSYVTLVALLMYCVAYGAWLNVTSPVFLMYMGVLMINSYDFSISNKGKLRKNEFEQFHENSVANFKN